MIIEIVTHAFEEGKEIKWFASCSMMGNSKLIEGIASRDDFTKTAGNLIALQACCENISVKVEGLNWYSDDFLCGFGMRRVDKWRSNGWATVSKKPIAFPDLWDNTSKIIKEKSQSMRFEKIQIFDSKLIKLMNV